MSKLAFDSDGENFARNALAHFIEIQSELTPLEGRLAREVAATLSPAEIRAWLAELSTMSVPDAVAKIRSFIGNTLKKEAVS
jgi:hypothetical protein